MLLAALRRERTPQTDRRRPARSNPLLWLFTIGSAVALWFMTTLMFNRFHAVGLDRSQVELFYPRPRSSVVLNFSDIVDVKVARAGRNCGHLEIATRQRALSERRVPKVRQCRRTDQADTVSRRALVDDRYAPFIMEIRPFQSFQSFNRFASFKSLMGDPCFPSIVAWLFWRTLHSLLSRRRAASGHSDAPGYTLIASTRRPCALAAAH